jgi:hypothetical protein
MKQAKARAKALRALKRVLASSLRLKLQEVHREC